MKHANQDESQLIGPTVPRSASPGRPRSERARQAILRSAGDLLERDGFANVTVDAIAAHAGVSKATIYRWWANKAAVITDSFLELTAPRIEFSSSGSVREDVRLHMRRLTQMLASSSGRVVAALIGAGQDDADVARAFLDHWIAVRRHETRRVLEAGVAQGELRPDIDLEVAMDALYGPIYYRLLIGHQPLSEAFTNALADHVLLGIGVP